MPLARCDASKQTPVYSTDSEHTYNRAMVCSAEVLKARSGIRNGVAVLVYYSTKLTGSFQNTILQSDPLRLGDLTIACCWMIYNFVTKTVLSLAI